MLFQVRVFVMSVFTDLEKFGNAHVILKFKAELPRESLTAVDLCRQKMLQNRIYQLGISTPDVSAWDAQLFGLVSPVPFR